MDLMGSLVRIQKVEAWIFRTLDIVPNISFANEVIKRYYLRMKYFITDLISSVSWKIGDTLPLSANLKIASTRFFPLCEF